MFGRSLKFAIALCVAAQLAAPSSASAADYRGASAGWPNYANGYYAANYPAGYAGGPAYYVARPVAPSYAAAGYSAAGYAAPPGGAMYMPVTAAYANPTYFAAYGRSPAAYRPVSTAGYAPVAGGYYAPAAAYAPVTANYAPANSYAVSPAGIGSAGSEAAGYFGQPTAVNYVPPRVTYRPTYAAVPVYMYRPVTAYQPVTGQPTTCMQASTCNTCMPQARRCGSGLSWLNPLNWFGHGGGGGCGSGGCGTSGCGAPPTTAYCQTNYCGSTCGQPYYPTQPVVPVVPYVPGNAVPTNIIPAAPGGYIPPAGVRISPPPTAAPGTRQIIVPADQRPNLGPGAFGPGATTPLPTQPSAPFSPGGSFPTQPQQPPTGFGGGSFPSGTNYAPATDPYSSSTLTPVESPNGFGGGAMNNQSSAPNPSVFGSGYRGSAARQEPSNSTANDSVIRAPRLAPALPPGVQTVPDPDVQESPRPVNSAPKLLDPRDKTAGRDPRWAVVPALWPTKATTGQLSDRPVAATKAYEPTVPLATSPYAQRPADAGYSDGGWKSAAF